MKVLQHDLRQVKYKILWVDSKKKLFFCFFEVNATEVTVLSVFLIEKTLEAFGVNFMIL